MSTRADAVATQGPSGGVPAIESPLLDLLPHAETDDGSVRSLDIGLCPATAQALRAIGVGTEALVALALVAAESWFTGNGEVLASMLADGRVRQVRVGNGGEAARDVLDLLSNAPCTNDAAPCVWVAGEGEDVPAFAASRW